jgi:hypothetical protein
LWEAIMTILGTSTAAPSRALPAPLLLSIAWFALAAFLGAAGAFVAAPGGPPVALGLAAGGPPIVAVALLVFSARFRQWAGARDLRLLTELQAWRTVGLAFLAVAAVGALPAGFAWPAGIGDLLVALTAPIVAVRISRGALSTSGYLWWTAFGVLDLIVAVALGVLHSDSPLGLLGDGVDTTAATQLPLVLIPTFFVPFLLTVHAISVAAVVRRRSGAGRWSSGAAALSGS